MLGAGAVGTRAARGLHRGAAGSKRAVQGEQGKQAQKQERKGGRNHDVVVC